MVGGSADVVTSVYCQRCYWITWNNDQHCPAPWPIRSKVKVARSSGPFKSCWPTCQNENSQKYQNLWRGCPIGSRSIGHRSRSPGWLMLKPKVCRLWTLNLIGCWSMRYQLTLVDSWPAIKACEVWLFHAGVGIPCLPHLAVHTTCSVLFFFSLYF